MRITARRVHSQWQSWVPRAQQHEPAQLLWVGVQALCRRKAGIRRHALVGAHVLWKVERLDMTHHSGRLILVNDAWRHKWEERAGERRVSQRPATMWLCRRQQLICRCVGRAACCVLGCRAAVRFYATAALGRRAPSNAAARRCQSQVPPPLNPQNTSQINPTCSHCLAHVVPEPLHPLLPLLALSQEDINQYKGAAGAQAAGGVRQKARLALLAAAQGEKGEKGEGLGAPVSSCSSQRVLPNYRRVQAGVTTNLVSLQPASAPEVVHRKGGENQVELAG